MTLGCTSFTNFLNLLVCWLNVFVIICRCTLSELFLFVIPRYKNITEEIILITGGGRGIGRRLALDFASYKPKHIVLLGRNEDWLIRTKEDVIASGVRCLYYICDVGSREQIYTTADRVCREVGTVSILVNNAGTVHGQSVADIPQDDFEHSLRVNTLSQIWTIKAFLPAMIAVNHGHIVCMCSTLGLLGLAGTADYTTSKFSLTGLMESLMSEVAEYSGVKMTTVFPYQVDNTMFAGCQVRFPWLFPKLTEEYVSKQTVSAILRNRTQVVIPWYFNLVCCMKSILPVSCLYPSLKFLGLHNMMTALVHKQQQ